MSHALDAFSWSYRLIRLIINYTDLMMYFDLTKRKQQVRVTD